MRKNNKIVVRQQDQASTSNNQKDKESKQVELQIANIEKSLQNWSIPIVKKCEVYKQHLLWNSSLEEICMLEYKYLGNRNNRTITILEQNMLDQHTRKVYNFIHLGLIQVAAKLNYQLGVNMPIIILLRDIRLL